MSNIIMPAGNSKFDWSPSEKKTTIVKTASADEKTQGAQEVAVEEEVGTDKDHLFEVAKQVVADLEKEAQFVEDSEDVEDVEDVEDTEDVIDDTTDEITDSPVEDAVEEGVEEGVANAEDVKDAIDELVDKAQEAEDVAGKVAEAVDKVEEAVSEVKDAISGGEVEVEVEVEVEDNSDVNDVNDVNDEVGGEDIVVESDEIESESCGTFASGEEDEVIEASADGFVKLSKISPNNRRKLVSFWKTYLDYVPDYVRLMVKDYEK